eukprot:2313188-Pyramimonas_sp.AAC.1
MRRIMPQIIPTIPAIRTDQLSPKGPFFGLTSSGFEPGSGAVRARCMRPISPMAPVSRLDNSSLTAPSRVH